MGKEKCLTKADLVELIKKKMDLEKEDAVKILETWIELMKESLITEGKLMISGFGAFEVQHKKSRSGRNPQTGERIILKPRKRIRFKPSQILISRINSPKNTLQEVTEREI